MIEDPMVKEDISLGQLAAYLAIYLSNNIRGDSFNGYYISSNDVYTGMEQYYKDLQEHN